MPSIDEVVAEWRTDAVLNDSRVDRELLKTPMLHAKYLEYYVYFKAKLAQSEKKHNKMMWVKRKYFRGEMELNELQKYGWSQWQGLKPSGAELNQLLEMDTDMNDLREVVASYKTSVSSLEYILKQIASRDWALKSIIEYNKFMAGA
jgi:hypothetical protein